MITSLNLHIEEGDEPTGDLSASIAILYLNGQGARAPRIISNPTPIAAAYLRKLATEADSLADAIDARLAEQAKPELTCYCDADLVAPHPFSECPHRMAESTAGETRDVPTPGAAG